MQKTYVEAQQALEAESQELKSLEAEKIKIVDTIDASNNALVVANEQLKKAELMIQSTNFLISKAEPCVQRKLLDSNNYGPRVIKFSSWNQRRR